MEISIDNKRYFIYNNIEKLENHDHVIKILYNHECKYTENNNGIFVNLNPLSNNIINELFFILKAEINNDNKIDNNRNSFLEEVTKQNEVINIQKEEKEKNEKKIIRKKIYIQDFNEEDGKIIKMSKINKFDII